MPLRDHFHSPWRDENFWEGFHSAWANTLVRHLNASALPRRYRAVPQVHLGALVEVDVATLERGQDAFEVRVLDQDRGMRLVGAIELISPANKDRAEHRRAFASKCAAYLQQQVGVAIVDVVTERRASLHQVLLELLAVDATGGSATDRYAVAYRTRKEKGRWQLDTWPAALTVGRLLPSLPLWLAADYAVAVDLERSYEETCHVLRIAQQRQARSTEHRCSACLTAVYLPAAISGSVLTHFAPTIVP